MLEVQLLVGNLIVPWKTFQKQPAHPSPHKHAACESREMLNYVAVSQVVKSSKEKKSSLDMGTQTSLREHISAKLCSTRLQNVKRT